MGGLRDQLVKAKLISSKEAKKAAREIQLKRKENLKNTSDPDTAADHSEYQTQFVQKQLKDQQLAASRRDEAIESARIHKIRDIIRNGMVIAKKTRNIRYYFVNTRGYIPYMMVNQAEVEDLACGNAAIVSVPQEPIHKYELVSRDAAIKIKKDGQEFLLVFNEKKEHKID